MKATKVASEVLSKVTLKEEMGSVESSWTHKKPIKSASALQLCRVTTTQVAARQMSVYAASTLSNELPINNNPNSYVARTFTTISFQSHLVPIASRLSAICFVVCARRGLGSQ